MARKEIDFVDFISDMFSNLLDLLGNFFEFIASLVNDIVQLAVQVWRMVRLIPSFFLWLPDTIAGLLVAGFSIVAVYKILGREG